MKKVILVLAVLAIGCTKEECPCGMITDDYVKDFSVDVRNDCSGKIKNFVLTEGDWMTAYVGTDICMGTSW